MWCRIWWRSERRIEGQRPGNKPAQGNALGNHPSKTPSPNGARQPSPVVPPRWGSDRLLACDPGRWPGLAWGRPFGPALTAPVPHLITPLAAHVHFDSIQTGADNHEEHAPSLARTSCSRNWHGNKDQTGSACAVTLAVARHYIVRSQGAKACVDEVDVC